MQPYGQDNDIVGKDQCDDEIEIRGNADDSDNITDQNILAAMSGSGGNQDQEAENQLLDHQNQDIDQNQRQLDFQGQRGKTGQKGARMGYDPQYDDYGQEYDEDISVEIAEEEDDDNNDPDDILICR